MKIQFMPRHLVFIVCGVLMTVAVTACQSTSAPIKTMESVDLPRFMGDWYVIGNIPTPLETDAYNALEQYALNDDGTVATTFTFNKGSLDGPVKVYRPKAFVRENTGNAVWGMQFIWPIKAEYRVMYVDETYQIAVVGRSKRDYLWIMARQPQIEAETYGALLGMLREQGYDTDKIRQVPHSL